MLWHRFLTIIFFLICVVLSTSESSEAVLGPEEILVVVNTESRDSVYLGKFYIELRHIPPAQIAEIKAPVQDEISRKQYNKLIAVPLKETINRLQVKGKRIRCIVTTYGVPLRIRPQRPQDTSGMEIGKDTIAAVDSELALLLSPPYKLAGWQVNPEFLYFRDRVNDPPRILMVSRLDAPDPGLVEKMIRTAIEVEQTGLSGKFYLDARGLTGKDAYSEFDENIRETARILQKGSMPVVLDNRPELFGTGEAPSAALYCGWYSLGEYRDAFEWSKGAVGYHVASAEAKSLHDPKHSYWVKSMLGRGVIASLGPVTEPYLTAFPLPSLFFQLLMSGQYSLAEVFAMSNPFLSWQMVLVGDPLYNPFKQKPAYSLKDPPPPP